MTMFWFFGHPEVYIIALPFFGIVTEIFPVFSRKAVFGYEGLIYATIAIGALSTAVWAHHMFATGAVLLGFFSLTTFLLALTGRAGAGGYLAAHEPTAAAIRTRPGHHRSRRSDRTGRPLGRRAEPRPARRPAEHPGPPAGRPRAVGPAHGPGPGDPGPG
jgi:hypothetical protein